MAYPHKWSPISYKPSAGQRKHIGQRPMLYHWTTPPKMGGWWRWALVSLDGVAPSRMVGVSASVNLSLHHKVQKFSSGTGSPGWCQKKGRKTVVVWWLVLAVDNLHIKLEMPSFVHSKIQRTLNVKGSHSTLTMPPLSNLSSVGYFAVSISVTKSECFCPSFPKDIDGISKHNSKEGSYVASYRM